MAIKFSTKLQTATIEHPLDSNVKVRVRRIPRIDLLAFQQEIAKAAKVVPLLDGNGEPILDKKTKKPLTETVSSITFELVLKILDAAIVGWEGIENDNGPYGWQKGRASILLEEAFDFEDSTPNEETGEEEKTTTSFAVYLMNKILDGATFGDADSGN